MRNSCLFAAALALVTACGGDRGDDGEGGACDGNGSGVVTGTVMGAGVGTVIGASAGSAGDSFIIFLSDGGNACDGSAAGDELVLSLCSEPTAQTYAIGSDGCPGTEASGRLVNDEGSDVASPSSGSIVITSAASDCITGTFSLDFANNETLTGSFAAVVCTLQL